jgi:hypothetical protein
MSHAKAKNKKSCRNVKGVNYKTFKQKGFQFHTGSRASVFHGTAYKTTGGLTCKDLKLNTKTNRIVSVKKSRSNPGSHLGKYLDLAKKNKGSFKLMRKL